MCAVCNIRHRVQVHHIVPRHEGGSDDASNAIPLCPNCHSEVHAAYAAGRTTRIYTAQELRGHLERTIDLANRQANLVPAGEISQERRLSAGLPNFEYGRILLPNVPTLREVHDPKTRVPSYYNDASILFYLIEEFVRFGVIDVAVDAYRYADVLPTLPRIFRSRIIEVEHAASTAATLEIIRPVAVEHNVKITASTYGLESIAGSVEVADTVRSSLLPLILDLDVFIRGMRHGLLVALDIKRIRAAIKTLLGISRSKESRANLVTLEQLFSFYRPHRVGAATMTSTAPAGMVELFEVLVSNPLYRELSEQAPSMGLIGQGSEAARAVTRAARRLTEQEETLSFGRYSAFLPSESLRLDNADADHYFNLNYFPPIVSMKKAIASARIRWQQQTPELVPIGQLPPTERFLVGRDDGPR
jgi:hypothetical protein